MMVRSRLTLLRTAFFAQEAIENVANEQMATTLVCRLCKPHGTFLDVGAHIGSIFSSVLRHDPSVKVIAIEAIPEKVANLRSKFPAIELHECAVGSESTGDVSFFVDTKQSGYSSLQSPKHAAGVREIHVAMRTLDELIPADVNVDVIKIDVEGAELGVLQGGKSLIGASRPTIMFESGPEAPIYSKEAMWEWLTAHDYIVLVPNRLAHDGEGLTLQGFIESHYYPMRTMNYFAVAAERRTEIRDAARRILKIQPR